MKIFEGEMFIRCQTMTLLQIFCELMLYFKIIFKIMRVADVTLSVNGLRIGCDNDVLSAACLSRRVRSRACLKVVCESHTGSG